MSENTLNIKTLEELSQLTTLPSNPSERKALASVLKRFPVRVSSHLAQLMKHSEPIAKQFLPDAREITTLSGASHCFTGLMHTGIAGVERMYADRCIIMPQPTCPAYCRYCFRKFYEHSDGRAMKSTQIDDALAYVARESALREVLITGGEPVMDSKRLFRLLDGLRRIRHIGPIRIACRSLITNPGLITDEWIAGLKHYQDLRSGEIIEVALHCNHLDELSEATIDRLASLREHAIHVYNQAVLLRDINLDADTMMDLLRGLRKYGVETYHLYFGGPVPGMDHQRPTLEEALALKSEIRRRGTGRLNPHLIVTTRIGKVELGIDGWICEREPGGRWTWLRTPYTVESFRSIDPSFDLADDMRLGADGRIVVRYLDGPTTESTTGSRELTP